MRSTSSVPALGAAKSRLSQYVWLSIITGVALGLRLYRLDAQSVWFDESFSVSQSVRPLGELLRILEADIVHPPLHYLALHVWFGLVGYGAFEARLLSALIGTLSIPMLYLLARRFVAGPASLCAAFLLATAQFSVYFSQEARMYAQAQLLSLVTAVTFLSYLEKPALKRSMVVVAAIWALLSTHYYGTGVIAALLAYWFLYRKHFPNVGIKQLAVIGIVAGLLFAPWLVAVARNSNLSQKGWAQHESMKPGLSAPIGAVNRFNNTKFASIEAETEWWTGLAGLVLLTLPAGWAVWRARAGKPDGAVLGVLLSAFPLLMAIGMGKAGVVFNFRHYCFAAPGYYLAVAIGVASLPGGRIVKASWVTILAAWSTAALQANYAVPTKPDYRIGLRPIAERYQPGDCAIVLQRAWRDEVPYPWLVYYRHIGPLHPIQSAQRIAPPDNCRRIWIISDKTWWMNLRRDWRQGAASLLKAIEPEYATRFETESSAMRVWLLDRR